ncbi:MAG: hypothetical protein ISQ08_03045 [Planctomycetes bacterium]|nr:hypothetical protein [Planctomycetota bacterium]MDA0946919.1 hypothetical protein [Planctomycetota bacterium]
MTLLPLLLASALAPAGDGASSLEARFAPPALMTGADKPLGGTKMYPSPAAHDVDRDGKLDLVLGDLPGRITWSRRGTEGMEREQPFEKTDGTQLNFSNW